MSKLRLLPLLVLMCWLVESPAEELCWTPPNSKKVSDKARETKLEKEARSWEGMTTINNDYNWLRPPDSVLERTIDETYSGLKSRPAGYTYDTHLRFGGFWLVSGLRLKTPAMLAAQEGAIAREKFLNKPFLKDVRAHRGEFWITVYAESDRMYETPGVAVFYSDGFLQPKDQFGVRPLGVERCKAAPQSGTMCWHNVTQFWFSATESEKLSGVGFIVMRWRDTEHNVPVNFDYLW